MLIPEGARQALHSEVRRNATPLEVFLDIDLISFNSMLHLQ